MREDWRVMRLLLFRWMGNLVPKLGNARSRTIFSVVLQQGTSQCHHGGWTRRVCESMASYSPDLSPWKLRPFPMLKKENCMEASSLRTTERTKLQLQCWKSGVAKRFTTFLRNVLEKFWPMYRMWRLPPRRAKMIGACRAGRFWIKKIGLITFQLALVNKYPSLGVRWSC